MNEKDHQLVNVTWEEFARIHEGDFALIEMAARQKGEKGPNIITLYYEKSNELRFDSILGVSIPSQKLQDFFAWSYTELEGLTPFNDTLRITTLPMSDLVRVTKSSEVEQDYEVWSLVILGEMLTRMNSTKSLGAVNLSWINATFSKAAVLSIANKWSEPKNWKIFTEALDNVYPAKEELSHRALINEMVPVWNVACAFNKKPPYRTSLRDPEGFILYFSSILEKAGVLKRSDTKELLAIIKSFSFDSDSVETRLLGFDKMVQRFGREWHDNQRKSFWAIALGLSASFVGRGPSHLHLLDATSSAPDSRFMWGALIAQYSEKERLPSRWSKTIKQIARELSGQARLGWGNGYDIGRHEFEWLSNLPQVIDFEPFRGLRSTGGNMLVELLPGVTFQVRTGSSEKSSRSNIQSRVSQDFQVVKETLSSLQLQLATLQRRVGAREGQADGLGKKRNQQELFED